MNIFEEIEKYNKNCSNRADKIKFVHGGSSGLFGFMGTNVTLANDEQKTIPNALIPTGVLRKKYGVYPVSGELDNGVFARGSRKLGINYDSISGMRPDKHGVDEALRYAERFTKPIDINNINSNIETLIRGISVHTYRGNLKKILMHTTNLMILSNDTNQSEYYIDLLKAKFSELKKESFFSQEVETKFNKYLGYITDKLQGKNIPFKANELFNNAVLDQFPILLCSSTMPQSFSGGVHREQIISGEYELMDLDYLEYFGAEPRKIFGNCSYPYAATRQMGMR